MADFLNNQFSPIQIVVLAGGDSAEREISLQSGAAVSNALRDRGHRVTQVDPAAENLLTRDWSDCDRVFIALHGTWGEDGEVQTLLESLGIPYTGSSAEVSELAFKKSAAKERFILNDVPTPSYVLVHESDPAATIHQKASSLGFPLVVKPNAQGSSLGVTIVRSLEELPQALTRCFHYDSFGLLEQAVEGSEWTLGIANGKLLPLIKVESDREFYDYEAKYVDNDTRFLFEFDLPQAVIGQLEELGERALEALGVTGVARVDMRLDRFDRPWVLEINTVPGFTSHSLIPMAAERVGLSLGEVCENSLKECIPALPVEEPQRKLS